MKLVERKEGGRKGGKRASKERWRAVGQTVQSRKGRCHVYSRGWPWRNSKKEIKMYYKTWNDALSKGFVGVSLLNFLIKFSYIFTERVGFNFLGDISYICQVDAFFVQTPPTSGHF